MSATAPRRTAALCILLSALPLAGRSQGQQPAPTAIEANHVAEFTLTSAKPYDNPFLDVQVGAIVTPPGGETLHVPAFWAGGNLWRFRYASPVHGRHTWRTECSDAANAGLQGVEGALEVVPNTAVNPLYQHGPIRVADDHRHFVHADGTPFLWLGDTWWKCLCKRLTWEGFQELTADRKAKGFSVVQIVCGPYPDEGFLEPRLANEGGLPYESISFDRVNPEYFDYADRRLKHLVDAGIAPAIVGAWGRGDCNSMEAIGAAGLKRHWRYLVARYSAYPVSWILAGEIPEETKWGQGPWAEVATCLRRTDPYHRLLTCHTGQGRRGAPGDSHVIDFDMVGGNHDERVAVAPATVAIVSSAYSKEPPMPVLVGETCYEGHMQQGFGDVQRRVFWSCMLSGAAGHTYGAAGIWHASVEGDPGCASSAFGGTKVYDWTTWEEGMSYPGATQLGTAKRLLEQYPWSRFEPHPEWAPGCIAAGIPREVRFIYRPRGQIYNWSGPVVHGLERDVVYHARYFDPASGRVFDQGDVVNVGPPPDSLGGPSERRLFEDHFESPDVAPWRDYGTPTTRENGVLLGGKGMLTVLEGISEADVAVGVEARSDAEAGVVLRFRSPDRYLVALYTPLLQAIYIHDRREGEWGPPLGKVAVPEVGPRIRLTATACGRYAALAVTDGERTYRTPLVKVTNAEAGATGLWLFQIGDRQEYDGYWVSQADLPLPHSSVDGSAPEAVWSGDWQAPDVPSPQDWVLVLERARP